MNCVLYFSDLALPQEVLDDFERVDALGQRETPTNKVEIQGAIFMAAKLGRKTEFYGMDRKTRE